MPKVKELKRRPQVAAVLVAHGVPAPARRVRWASYGAGVAVPGVVPIGVEIVTEAQAALRPRKKTVTLTRFAPGTRIPAQYRVIAELAVEE